MSKALTVEEAPGLNYKERENLGTIWRRIRFLDARIAEHEGNPSRDIAEVSCLRWLLREAEMPAPVNPNPKQSQG